ncbi:DUF7088 domain-containing protein [Bariatricus sp. HCP28S3_F11]|uniref:DUF7088 domain-containing protein n=1 Tax=unclassified Bariatricus TaxID=2677046 RepID=UPI002A9DFE21|nr:Gldg family protein [bacterium]MDY5457709.1 Gldg family protein [Bariatricus sp.]
MEWTIKVKKVRTKMKSISRRRKYGVLATTISILGVVLIVAANIVVDKLTDKYEWSKDLTEDERYAITEESIRCVKELESNVKITVFVDEESMASGSYYLVQAYQNILEYERNSDKVEVEFVDLVENPTYIAKYPELNLSAYDILVESDKGTEVLSLQEMYEYDSSGSTITGSKVEQMITNAIVTVTSEAKTKAVVLTGYGKTYPNELVELLEANQYDVEEQSLLTGEISKDAETAILYAPQGDLEEISLKSLRTWLDNDGKQGKSLFVFLDPTIEKLPRLEEFLNEWGIALGEGYAFEANKSLYYDKFYYPIAQYADKDYAENLTGDDLTIMALCRPVDVLFDTKDNYTTSVLLNFSTTSGAIKLGETEVTNELVTGDVKGMVMSSHDWYGTEVNTSNVVVSGSALAFSESLITSDTFANSDYILGVFRKLNNRDTGYYIETKEFSMPMHSMTGARTNMYVWIFMVILPVVVFAAGIVVWMKRKNC